MRRGGGETKEKTWGEQQHGDEDTKEGRALPVANRAKVRAIL
jgi:hypothetical protein